MAEPTYQQCARCGSLMVDRAAHLSWHIETDRHHSDLVAAVAALVDGLVSVSRVQDLTDLVRAARERREADDT